MGHYHLKNLTHSTSNLGIQLGDLYCSRSRTVALPQFNTVETVVSTKVEHRADGGQVRG